MKDDRKEHRKLSFEDSTRVVLVPGSEGCWERQSIARTVANFKLKKKDLSWITGNVAHNVLVVGCENETKTEEAREREDRLENANLKLGGFTRVFCVQFVAYMSCAVIVLFTVLTGYFLNKFKWEIGTRSGIAPGKTSLKWRNGFSKNSIPDRVSRLF